MTIEQLEPGGPVGGQHTEELAVENGWPQPRSERRWGAFTVFSTSIATAIATWCFIIGGFVSYYLTAVPGTLAIVAGSLIGMFFIVLALLPVCTKYGIDSVTCSRPQFGVRGSLLSVLIIFGTTLGWNLILFIFMGRATTSILRGFGIAVPGWTTGAAGVLGILAVLSVLSVLRAGPHKLRDLGPPIAALTLVFGLIVMFLLVRRIGISALLSAPAVAPSADPHTNWASGLEVLIASNLSWWAYTGGIVRNSPSSRTSLWSIVVGLGLGVGAGSLAGFYAGLVIPGSGGDPTQFLIRVGGPAIGILLLLFIIIADLGTAMPAPHTRCSAVVSTASPDRARRQLRARLRRTHRCLAGRRHRTRATAGVHPELRGVPAHVRRGVREGAPVPLPPPARRRLAHLGFVGRLGRFGAATDPALLQHCLLREPSVVPRPRHRTHRGDRGARRTAHAHPRRRDGTGRAGLTRIPRAGQAGRPDRP
ncbi:cytosine permease [Streptomyces samsunensis]|uniref:Cytosine permease n=1 Tax=Streptomyces malaysiensis subsp. samsunensis TaxID=459658 RepID=A0A9X2RUB8_STRMQ|nr:cytosine permease [Streptomyces samsunensis]MCQ8828599.1 cytosine permease [Streptomyces samsunensis]